MFVDRRNAQFRDITGVTPDMVTTDGNGNGVFSCNGGSVSVWVEV
jgi:alpha-amylase